MAGCWLTSRTAVADVPTIRLLPLERVSSKVVEASTSVDPTVKPGGQVFLDSPLPAGTQFQIELRLSDLPPPLNDDARAVLRLWPLAEQARLGGSDAVCGSEAPRDSRQFYELGMTVAGEGAKQALTATVPVLQIGQRYCLGLEIRARLSKPTFETIAKNAAARIAAQMVTTKTLDCGNESDLAKVFTKGLVDSMASLYKDVDLTPAVQAALLRHVLQQEKCASVRVLDARADGQAIRIGQANALHEARLLDIKSLPVLVWGKPPLFGSKAGTEPLDAMLKRSPTVPELRAAVKQLARVGMKESDYGPGDLELIRKWGNRLTQLADAVEKESDAAKVKKAYQEAQSDTRSWNVQSVELWDGTVFIPEKAYRQAPTALEAIRMELRLLQARVGGGSAVQESYAKWIGAIDTLRESEVERRAATDSQAAVSAEREKARDALVVALVTTLNSDEIRQALSFSVGQISVQQKAGVGKTTDAASFASLDVGVLLALPHGGTSVEPWVLPYVGLNLYAVPVDRTMDLGQLTGSAGERFLQRVSLTAGFTLSNPGIPGRTVKPIFLERYPLLALGVRFSQFTRFTGGVAFYKLADKNYASAAESVEVAPFVGLSIDADLYYFAQQLFTTKIK